MPLSVPVSPTGPEPPDPARFLDDLRRVGTQVTGPHAGELLDAPAGEPREA